MSSSFNDDINSIIRTESLDTTELYVMYEGVSFVSVRNVSSFSPEILSELDIKDDMSSYVLISNE